ncbi:undecaprenyl/decaprenyl-phosphate alpha-N-acetylglucosaminyl 1-phosphate transferase [Candidatus Microgenomates bacterium]|nr:undecaprenyl/decaprenyl-phosphate alpha-N-acetylglucosaminyl 1-phosphate transferase [Candidatus Microgenomates bacterium]
MMYKQLIFYPFLMSFLASFLVTPLVIKIANLFGLVDSPRERFHPAHVHRGVIPRAGGLAIFIGTLIASLAFLPLDRHLKGILFGAVIVIIIGLLDDKYDLSPHFRLLTNFLAALCVIWAGVGIAFINNPFGGIIYLSGAMVDLFAIFWIVWCMNMVNWSKGVDGQMPGFVAIAAVVIGILSLKFSADITQWSVTILAFITAGSYLGFLPWNFYPQKIMPGYSGGSLGGYLLAVLSILSTAKMGTMILVLAVPLIDGVYTIIRRLAAGKLPFWGDRGHLHHRLLDLGWGKRRIAIFYWLVSAVLGIVALNLNPRQKLYTTVLLVVLIGGFLLWLSQLSRSLKK